MHALGLEFGSAAQLSKRPGSVWNCLWGNALKRSPGIIRKSRVSYPGPGFLSSATWPSLPKKHYNGLNQTKLISKRKLRKSYTCPLILCNHIGIMHDLFHVRKMFPMDLIWFIFQKIGYLSILKSISLSVTICISINHLKFLSAHHLPREHNSENELKNLFDA